MKTYIYSTRNGSPKSLTEGLSADNHSLLMTQVIKKPNHKTAISLKENELAENNINSQKQDEFNLSSDNQVLLVKPVIEENYELLDDILINGNEEIVLESNLTGDLAGQSLDHPSLDQPWWIFDSNESNGTHFFPWLVGATSGLVVLGLSSGKGGKSKHNDKNSDTASNSNLDAKTDTPITNPNTKTDSPLPIAELDPNTNKPTSPTESNTDTDTPFSSNEQETNTNQPAPPIETDTPTTSIESDTTINKPIITFDDLTGDNSLDDKELSESTVTITGQITGIDADVEITKTGVVLSVNGKSTQATITGNSFSANVNSSDLKADSEISAYASVTDKHNNSAISNIVTRSYSVFKEPVTVNIDSITIQKNINADEVQHDLVVNGKVSYVTEGQVVEVIISDTNYSTDVNPNGSFSCIVSGINLERIEDYTISVQIKGDTNSTPANAYSIAEYMTPSIMIKHIENDAHINSDEQLVGLSGKVDFSETIFEQGANSSCVNAINIKIGDSIYNAGINIENQTFYIDAKLSDLNKANGLPISYTIETSSKVLEISNLNFGEKYQNVIEVTDAPLLNESNTKLFMDSNPVIKFDGSTYQIDSNPIDEVLTTKVNGIATGAATAGSEVIVEIASQIYKTTLNTDKSFTVAIKSNDLLTSEALKVKATLNIIGQSDEIISVSDESEFIPIPTFDSSMISWTSKLLDYQQLPYFIQVLDVETFQYDRDFGYLADHEHGSETGTHTINYYFANSDEALVYSSSKGELSNPIDYTGINKNVISDNFHILEKYIDVDFNQVNSINDTDITYYMSDINGGDITPSKSYLNGYATYGGSVVLASEIFGDNPDSRGSLNSSKGISAAFHETMHSLGAKHPFEVGLGSMKLDNTIDSKGVTLMSYNKDSDFNEGQDIRIYDLAYLQYRFGVNPDQRADDDTYTFKTFNQSKVDGDIYIWDGGGTDTFDASREKQGVYVNLTPGSDIYNDKNNTDQSFFAVQGELINNPQQYFPDDINEGENFLVVEENENDSYVIHKQISTVFDFTQGHSFIGYGTQIENLNGSAFNDTLIGNKANNLIYGGNGDDIIHGGEGSNYLDGGEGDDVYLINNTSNTIIEFYEGGDDIVFSSASSYQLDSNVEHLVLTETAISGIGNDLDNNIVGNQLDNVLQGKIGNDNLVTIGGNDILTGGSGSDTFVIRDILDNTSATITDFNQDEGDLIQLNIEVFNSLNPSDLSSISQFINYDSLTGELSYDNDGLSSTDAIHFTTISKELQFDESWFSVV